MRYCHKTKKCPLHNPETDSEILFQRFLERFSLNRCLFGEIEFRHINFENLSTIAGKRYSDAVIIYYIEYKTVIPKLYYEDYYSKWCVPMQRDIFYRCAELFTKMESDLSNDELELKKYIAKYGFPQKI